MLGIGVGRRHLGVERWSVLGQSFGGFCALHYLSVAPDSLREVFFTGGLPPIGASIDEVYRATYATVLDRNRRFYARYPGDRATVARIHDELGRSDVRLPGGDRLTSARLRLSGVMLGGSDGAEALHYLLDQPFGSAAFLHDVEKRVLVVEAPVAVVDGEVAEPEEAQAPAAGGGATHARHLSPAPRR